MKKILFAIGIIAAAFTSCYTMQPAINKTSTTALEKPYKVEINYFDGTKDTMQIWNFRSTYGNVFSNTRDKYQIKPMESSSYITLNGVKSIKILESNKEPVSNQ